MWVSPARQAAPKQEGTTRMSEQQTPPNYIELAADLVSAFVSNNPVPAAELPALIGATCTWPIPAPSWLAKAATTCTPSLPSCPAGALPRRRLPSIATVPSGLDPCAQAPNTCSVAATSRAL